MTFKGGGVGGFLTIKGLGFNSSELDHNCLIFLIISLFVSIDPPLTKNYLEPLCLVDPDSLIHFMIGNKSSLV